MTSPLNTVDIERFWKLESIGITPEEEVTSGPKELQTYMDTCIYYKDNQYSLKLPWKEDHPLLPTNYDVAVSRTQNMIKRLRTDPYMFQKYDDIINEQRERGFIETVDENLKTGQPVHYIPHHSVRKESLTTPIRIVYDCSCRRSSNEPSLNDCLQSTPPKLNDQTGIFMRF
ncbi:uncharacterized protein LOC127861830 [Dreissena polymorpha]|uniref:uncharacterized protein LOC127861830 n=1 Tax=Dreissena polymorpha TaxID=45954 RepID=UPI002263C4C1|nr:uncharacterized protein LOC127861830 [Dreissena polymorpha]